MSEKIYSKTAARLRLGISRVRYQQLIEAGILGEPFVLVENSRPVHTETQLRRCEVNLIAISSKEHLRRARNPKAIKPLSDKILQEICL